MLSVYPATITTNSPRSSSIRLRIVSTASFPKSFSPPSLNAYASSTNKTPPMALLITSFVLSAVWPTYPPTKSCLSHSTKLPRSSIPSAL